MDLEPTALFVACREPFPMDLITWNQRTANEAGSFTIRECRPTGSGDKWGKLSLQVAFPLEQCRHVSIWAGFLPAMTIIGQNNPNPFCSFQTDSTGRLVMRCAC